VGGSGLSQEQRPGASPALGANPVLGYWQPEIVPGSCLKVCVLRRSWSGSELVCWAQRERAPPGAETEKGPSPRTQVDRV
ncbi:hypothetical protein LEMLEM_LOCUS25141, partial [Lemmus lemmus]